jgi:hypothetical protein
MVRIQTDLPHTSVRREDAPAIEEEAADKAALIAEIPPVACPAGLIDEKKSP